MSPAFVYILLGLAAITCNSPTYNEPQHETGTVAIDSVRLISVVGVGDIMLGTDYPHKRHLPPGGECLPLLEPAIEILSNADVTFGNLEGSFLDRGPVVKRCADSTKCYAFRMPSAFAQCLAASGFDVLSLANNHIGDFGEKGRQNTMHLLDSLGISFGGLQVRPTSIFERSGVRFGFCAFAPNTGTCQLNDIAGAKRMVSELKAQCDIVIVSFHGGAEGASHRNVTRKTEMFYGENRGNVYEFARHVIDAGADVVFGHGPHVTRAIDLYKGRFIAYSLGNFCTYSRFNLSGPNGMAPIIKVFIDEEGQFVKGQIFATEQRGEGGVSLDPSNRVIKEIQRLTAADFPESHLHISDLGEIIIK